jgi:hypothetical protein
MSDEELTTISLTKGTRDRLKTYGMKGMSWDKLLNELMDQLDDESAASTDLSYQLNGKNEY